MEATCTCITQANITTTFTIIVQARKPCPAHIWFSKLTTTGSPNNVQVTTFSLYVIVWPHIVSSPVNALKFQIFYSILILFNFVFNVFVSQNTRWNGKQWRPWICIVCIYHFVRKVGVQKLRIIIIHLILNCKTFFCPIWNSNLPIRNSCFSLNDF